MASGVVHITWYATGLRADKLEKALVEISELSPRYGATGYQLYRSRDDRYKFLQMLNFDSKLDFERYWDGPEVTDFRIVCSGWYQVPITYVWNDLVAYEQLPSAEPVPLVGPPHESELA
jgi:hypothetical protein